MTLIPEHEVGVRPHHDHPGDTGGEDVGPAGPPEPPPHPAGEEIAPGYVVIEHMRRGHDFDTYDAWSAQRYTRCFLKTTRPDRVEDTAARRALRREARLLLAFTHPHIVRAYELITSPIDHAPVLVLETLTGPTLSDIVDGEGGDDRLRLPADSVGYLGRQLCSAMRYVHDHGHLHLDIKPSNIIASEGHARLIDFSLARPPGRCRRGRGTADYMAPEQATGGRLDAATDVWAVGLALYVAATGDRPFAAADPAASRTGPKLSLTQRYPQLVHPVPPLRGRRRFPRQACELIDACLRADPVRRPSLGQLDDALTTLTGERTPAP